MSTDQHIATARHMIYTADMISAGAVLGSLLGFLPPLAALVAILWYIVQIWESKTVVKWRQRRQSRKRVIERLEAAERKKHEPR